MHPRVIGTILGLFTTAALASCIGGPIRDLDQAVDCDDVCDRYRTCFDSDYDTDACWNRCIDEVENDPLRANQCDRCLDGKACAESAVCFDDCQGILP